MLRNLRKCYRTAQVKSLFVEQDFKNTSPFFAIKQGQLIAEPLRMKVKDEILTLSPVLEEVDGNLKTNFSVKLSKIPEDSSAFKLDYAHQQVKLHLLQRQIANLEPHVAEILQILIVDHPEKIYYFLDRENNANLSIDQMLNEMPTDENGDVIYNKWQIDQLENLKLMIETANDLNADSKEVLDIKVKQWVAAFVKGVPVEMPKLNFKTPIVREGIKDTHLGFLKAFESGSLGDKVNVTATKLSPEEALLEKEFTEKLNADLDPELIDLKPDTASLDGNDVKSLFEYENKIFLSRTVPLTVFETYNMLENALKLASDLKKTENVTKTIKALEFKLSGLLKLVLKAEGTLNGINFERLKLMLLVTIRHLNFFIEQTSLNTEVEANLGLIKADKELFEKLLNIEKASPEILEKLRNSANNFNLRRDEEKIENESKKETSLIGKDDQKSFAGVLRDLSKKVKKNTQSSLLRLEVPEKSTHFSNISLQITSLCEELKALYALTKQRSLNFDEIAAKVSELSSKISQLQVDCFTSIEARLTIRQMELKFTETLQNSNLFAKITPESNNYVERVKQQKEDLDHVVKYLYSRIIELESISNKFKIEELESIEAFAYQTIMNVNNIVCEDDMTTNQIPSSLQLYTEIVQEKSNFKGFAKNDPKNIFKHYLHLIDTEHKNLEACKFVIQNYEAYTKEMSSLNPRLKNSKHLKKMTQEETDKELQKLELLRTQLKEKIEKVTDQLKSTPEGFAMLQRNIDKLYPENIDFSRAVVELRKLNLSDEIKYTLKAFLYDLIPFIRQLQSSKVAEDLDTNPETSNLVSLEDFPETGVIPETNIQLSESQKKMINMYLEHNSPLYTGYFRRDLWPTRQFMSPETATKTVYSRFISKTIDQLNEFVGHNPKFIEQLNTRNLSIIPIVRNYFTGQFEKEIKPMTPESFSLMRKLSVRPSKPTQEIPEVPEFSNNQKKQMEDQTNKKRPRRSAKAT